MTRFAIIAAILVGACGGDDGGDDTGEAESRECRLPGDSCSDAIGSCCAGATCIADTRMPETGTCAALCNSHAECQSGCCEVVQGETYSACAPANYCASVCIEAGGACNVNPGGCCSDSTCVTDATGSFCAAICSSASQCRSACCAPLDNAPVSVCSPPTFCG